jgi:alpha-glucosidase
VNSGIGALYLGEDVFKIEKGKSVFTFVNLPKPRRCLRGGNFVLRGDEVSVTCREGRISFQHAGLELWRDVRPVTFDQGRFIIFKAKEEARYFGLGEKAGRFERSGQRFKLQNKDPFTYNRKTDPLYFSVPFLLVCGKGYSYGVLVETTSDSVFDLRGKEILIAGEGEGVSYYFIHGPTPAEVLRKYTALVGRAPLPPLWALGYHQARFSYMGEREVLRIAGEFRRREIPCDAIYLDIDYMEGYKCFTWNPRLFPEPERTISELRKMGFKVVTIVDPGLKVEHGYKPFEEGASKGFFLSHSDGRLLEGYVWPGKCVFPDFARREVREWWASLHAELLGKGVKGIWNDMNEPTLKNLTPNLRAGMNLLAQFKKIDTSDVRMGGVSFGQMKNYYAVLEAEATCIAFQKFYPGKRPFVLSRSGWAGIQKYAAVWTGDNYSTWDHLKLSVEMIMSIGISGIPFVGADIGGFTILGPKWPFLCRCSPELFARWIQVGVFYPFCRTHTSKPARYHEPWRFGPKVERIARGFIRLRYSLLPYLYSVFWEHTQNGMPIVRPLFLHWPQDEQCYRDDEFMFGPFLLVAPVFKKGQRKRQVYLPDGWWYDFWTNEKVEGGQTITADAPLERIPIFVRAGAILPLWPVLNYVGEKPIDELRLVVYPGNGKFTLYEDDGESIKSDFAIRTLSSTERGRDLLVEIGKKKGRYRWHRRVLTLEVRGAEPREVRVGKKKMSGKLSVPDTGERLVFRVRF